MLFCITHMYMLNQSNRSKLTHIYIFNVYSSINGILEMVAFQDNFPSIFSKMATNSTDQSCSSGSGDNSDLLVVSDF